MSSLQGQIENRQQDQMQKDARETGDKIGSRPHFQGVSAGREEKRLGNSADDASGEHCTDQADVQIGKCFSGFYQTEQETGNNAVHG